MSASEKLRRLNQHLHHPVSGSSDEIVSARFLVGEALPQIVAVVEAAEWSAGEEFDPDGLMWQKEFLARLRPALAALDEALT